MNKRTIRLKSVRNLRTLGGLKTRDGQWIRPNLLLRSAALDHLSEKDAKILIERYHVTKVIDLRTEDERTKHPDQLPETIEYRYLPVSREQLPGVSQEIDPVKSREIHAGMLPALTDMYREVILDPECIQNISVILKEILSHQNGCILWHCTAGKDRCGMIAVLIEAILGCSRRTLLEDYLLTNYDSLRDGYKYYWLIRIFKQDKVSARMVLDAYRADASYLSSALHAIDESYGGLKPYVTQALGIDPKEIRAFRKRVLASAHTLS